MHPVRHAAVAALLGIALCSIPAAAQQSSPARHRLVVQVSDADPGKWNLALNNVRNVQTDLGASNVDIELVAYGPGIGMLKMDSPVGSRIGEAMHSGVKVVACENTMHAQKLKRDDMLPTIGYVKAGVVEIIEKQGQGYAYLRP